MSRLAAVAVIPTLMLAACAPTSPADTTKTASETSRRCVFSDLIQGYSADKDTAYVRAGSTVMKLDAAGFCTGLDTGLSLGIKAPMNSGQICVGDWVDVLVPDRGALGPCRARVEKSLTADEVAALPRNLRP